MAGRSEPVPPDLIRSAETLFSWRTIDAELAELSYDSLLDRDAAVLSRGSEQPRLLSFEGRAVALEVEVVETQGRRRLRGQLVPPQPGQVEARQKEGTKLAQADEMGRFRVEDLGPGPVSLRCRAGRAPDAALVETDWFLL